MRAWVTSAVMLLGCQGDPAQAPTDAAGDATADTADTDVADAIVFDAACPISTDLVPNGTFAAGGPSVAPWNKYNCAIASVEGPAPCGRALRVSEIADYGEVSQRVTRTLPSGTKLRLRAWVRGEDFVAGLPPSVSVAFFRSGDGGEVTAGSLSASPPSTTTTWTEVTQTITLADEVTAFDVRLNTNRAHGGPPALLFAGVSLVIEP